MSLKYSYFSAPIQTTSNNCGLNHAYYPKEESDITRKIDFVIVCLLSNGSSHSNIYCTHLLPTFAPWGSSQKRCTFKGVFFRPAGFYDVVLQISPISGANRGWCFVRWPKWFFLLLGISCFQIFKGLLFKPIEAKWWWCLKPIWLQGIIYTFSQSTCI